MCLICVGNAEPDDELLMKYKQAMVLHLTVKTMNDIDHIFENLLLVPCRRCRILCEFNSNNESEDRNGLNE